MLSENNGRMKNGAAGRGTTTGASTQSFSRFFLPLHLASISAPKFEATYKTEKSKTGVIGMAAIIAGKMMNLSVEAKVAIAVATGFVMLIVGAMAQG